MSRFNKKIKNTLIYWLVLYLILLVRLISRPAAFLFFRKLGILAFHVLRLEREKVLRHLRIAFGNEKSEVEILKLAKQVFIDLGRNGADALRVPLLNRNNLETLVYFEGIEYLDKALQRGKGAVLVTGHIGCWELLAAAVAMKGYPLFVIGKPLYDPRLDRIIVRTRQGSGAKNIPRGGSVPQILTALRENGILGILIDQDTNVDGAFVDFFGKPAFTPIGATALALKTGATVILLAIHLMDDNRHRILIRPPVKLELTGNKRKDIVANTQRLSDFLEEMIRLRPSQWVWMHERWKTRPEDIQDRKK